MRPSVNSNSLYRRLIEQRFKLIDGMLDEMPDEDPRHQSIYKLSNQIDAIFHRYYGRDLGGVILGRNSSEGPLPEWDENSYRRI